jgi:hypothetical protein
MKSGYCLLLVLPVVQNAMHGIRRLELCVYGTEYVAAYSNLL